MFLKTLLAAALMATAEGYRYSLPMHPQWPTQHSWNYIKNKVAGGIVLRGEAGYSVDDLYYNARTNKPQPAAIATPATTEDVTCLIRFARLHRMRVSVLSTGHNIDMANTADNSLMLHMKNINHMSVDHEAKTVTVGPGNNFQQLQAYVKEQTNGEYVQLTGADYSVGPFGWALGGGHGMLTRLYGLGADAMRGATIVLASGRVLMVSEDKHRNLFRALRGSGGPTYGVLTSLTFQLYPSPGAVTGWWGAYTFSDEVTEKYSAWMASAPNNAGAYWVPSNSGTISLFAHCFGEGCAEVLAPLRAISGCLAANPAFCNAALVFPDYATYVQNFPQINAKGANHYWMAGTTLAEDLGTQLKQVNTWINGPQTIPYTRACYANCVAGGASKDMDPHGKKTAMAQAVRDGVTVITCAVVYPPGYTVEQQKAIVADADNFAETVLKPFSPGGWSYWNEAQHNYPENDWKERYWGGMAAYRQLRRVKARYDPLNFLTCHHCVGWKFDTEVDPAICPGDCSCSNTPDGQCATYEQ